MQDSVLWHSIIQCPGALRALRFYIGTIYGLYRDSGKTWKLLLVGFRSLGFKASDEILLLCDFYSRRCESGALVSEVGPLGTWETVCSIRMGLSKGKGSCFTSTSIQTFAMWGRSLEGLLEMTPTHMLGSTDLLRVWKVRRVYGARRNLYVFVAPCWDPCIRVHSVLAVKEADSEHGPPNL